MAGNEELIRQYEKIHSERSYGNTSVRNLRFIRPDIKLLAPKSVLDYGCGQSDLINRLNLGYTPEIHRYDPAIPAYSKKPASKVDLLLNVDVLEHIEEKDLDAVLADMRALCRDALIIVDLKEAALLLDDGRNAHVTIKPREWWEEKISRHFGKVYPVTVARSSRAGFRTWERKDGATWALLRIRYTLAYYLYRLIGKRVF